MYELNCIFVCQYVSDYVNSGEYSDIHYFYKKHDIWQGSE